MWKVCGSSLVKRKSKSFLLFLPLIFLLGMAFCPQAHSGQANVAYFAGGCFWCTEAVFQEAPGVTSVVSGYMQGAEKVQISFDPAKTSYDKLLNLFWRAHNPTEVDRQGPDVGKQYRAMFFRSCIWNVTPGSCRFEDAFSDDGGKTWKVKGIAMDTRVKDESPPQISDPPKPTPKNASTEHDGQHDFDFEIGTWKTHLWRLVDPLTGSTKWVEYEGASVVRKIWNGRANLVELEVDGPTGHIEGLNLRLYNPQSRQWNLNFASSRSGTLSPPTIGEFKNGRGEFFSQETLNGQAILVRFVISDITPDSCRFEQAFSDDGGKTWKVNWIALDTRMKDEADKAH